MGRINIAESPMFFISPPSDWRRRKLLGRLAGLYCGFLVVTAVMQDGWSLQIQVDGDPLIEMQVIGKIEFVYGILLVNGLRSQ
jgi:hypothetical protein